MPTYEYECQQCGHTFEQFQSITAKPLKKCPSCGRNRAKRLLGAGAGVLFKGSGFYQTDYRSHSYRQAAKADSGKADSSSPPASSSGDAKAKPADARPAASAKAGGKKSGA